MALNDNLISSWNFDTVSGSNTSGEVLVNDISNNYSGKAVGFDANDNSFVLKEDIKTSKKTNFETLEGADTIKLVDFDDERTSTNKKPSSVSLMLENSMYQLINDEMLNLFATIDSYSFKFALPNNKYKYEYDKLIDLRKQFFEKVLEKPSIEKYVEFYKWLDSSLGILLDQLKPENASTVPGLKTTIESHLLERNKFKHNLPLTIQKNKYHTNIKPITVIKQVSGSSQNKYYVENERQAAVESTENILNKNYSSNNQIIQTSGKIVNNRSGKANKTVISSNFSAADGLSETYRHEEFDEFSVYNSLLNRAKEVRDAFNSLESSTKRYTQGETYGPFTDNNFVQRAIPYKDENFNKSGAIDYKAFADEETLYRQRNNILISSSNLVSNENFTVIEPPVEFASPVKHVIKMKDAFEDLEVYSPYRSAIGTFTPRTLQVTGTTSYKLAQFFKQELKTNPVEDTFYNKFQNLNISGAAEIKSVEILDNLFPRKDMFGREAIRNKQSLEEDTTITTRTSRIRNFWKKDIELRKRVTSARNCLDISNYNSTTKTPFTINERIKCLILDDSSTYPTYIAINYTSSNSNIFDSFHSSDSYYIDTNIQTVSSGSGAYTGSYIRFPDQIQTFGDLGPYSHEQLIKFILNSSEVTPRPSPQFIHKVYMAPYYGGGILSLNFTDNYSYNNISNEEQKLIKRYFQGIGRFGYDGNGSGAETTEQHFSGSVQQAYENYEIFPAYSSYEEFSENFKHLSQNKSFLPEYKITNITDYLANNDNSANYLSIDNITNTNTNKEKLNYLETDFSKFINKNSNKIKFKLSTVKKLLPYNGFYPKDFSRILCDRLYTGYIEGLSETTPADLQAINQAIFAPGALFNTIKAGIAMEFPTAILTSSIPHGTSSIYTKRFSGSDSRKLLVKSDILSGSFTFEDLLEPNNFFARFGNKYIAYLDPTHYAHPVAQAFKTGDKSTALGTICPSIKLDVLTSETNQNNQKIYKLLVNNYFAEIPNFFLRNSSLTNFVSEKESNFLQVQAGTIYGMRFTIDALKRSPFQGSFYGNISPDSTLVAESLFGPPVNSYNSGFSGQWLRQSFIQYCPPYLGKSQRSGAVDILFTPSETRVYSLQEIIQNIVIQNREPAKFFNSLDKSLLLSQSVPEIKTTFDSRTGLPLETNLENDNRWVIQTKMETPLFRIREKQLNFTDYQTASLFYDNAGSFILPPTKVDAYFGREGLSGIWNSLRPYSPDPILSLRVDESPLADKSLLNIIGLRKEKKDISAIADDKKISEAIMIIPYVEKNIGDALPETLKKYLTSPSAPPTYEIENNYRIKINRQTISNLLKVHNYSDNKLKIEKIKTILEKNESLNRENSIVQLMTKMVNYNVPPHLNWLYNKNIEPFVMYIIEIDHVLDKDDLADIWQGSLPKIGKTPVVEEISYEHALDKDELFEGLDINNFDLKAKIFKIKKRANSRYSDITANLEDNQGYSFSTNTTDIPWYSSNWPYDYFSLVELVNIKVGEVYESGSV